MKQRTYEGMFMLEPTKATQEWDSIKKEIIGMVERRGGEIISARKWGEKNLLMKLKVISELHISLCIFKCRQKTSLYYVEICNFLKL